MPGAESKAPQPPGYYFSLPRLLTKWRGGDARRTEKSWREANTMGLAVFWISYLFFARLLPGGAAGWINLLVLPSLAFATFLFWLMALYLNSLIIKVIRGGGFMSGVSDSRAQVVLVAALTTVFAFCLLRTGSWIRVVGAIWIIGVVLNHIAAALLAGSHADYPTS